MPRQIYLSSSELAELAEAALLLDLPDYAELLVTAAYHWQIGDQPDDDLWTVLLEVRNCAIGVGKKDLLTKQQRRVLRIIA